MTAAQLIKLFPRAWRERYGDEFLALVGDAPLGASQVIDIVSSALDARVSRDVRGATRRRAHAEGGVSVVPTLKQVCVYDRRAVFSKRDALAGAAALIAGTLVMSGAAIALSRSGFDAFGEAVASLAFPVSTVFCLPFTWMKGQPWKAQAVVLAMPVGLIGIATFIAKLI